MPTSNFMKDTILRLFAACLLAGCMVSPAARGQGTISINNVNGTGGLLSTDFGMFFDADATLYSATHINVTILGGPDANSLTPIVSLYGPNALVPVALGRYADSSGGIYPIPGVAPGQPATLQVLAWIGSAATFDGADIRQDVVWPFGGTGYHYPPLFTFTNPTGGAVPASLDGMPAMLRILDVPEPTSGALLALGIAALLWQAERRRRT